MKRFNYVGDSLCLAACSIYALNRWLLLPHVASPFLHSYLNDILIIPAALPAVLWLQRQLGLRTHDAPPTAGEILFHWVIWSVVCELIGPHLFHRSVGDPFDVVAYAAGALFAWHWWRSERHRQQAA
jgi:hypothetical protein